MKNSGRNGSKKKLGGTNMLNYSSELRKLSEGSGSRSRLSIDMRLNLENNHRLTSANSDT